MKFEILLLSLIFMSVIVSSVVGLGSYIDYSKYNEEDNELEPSKKEPPFRKIRYKSGTEIYLECKDHGCHHGNSTNKWEFMCVYCHGKKREWKMLETTHQCRPELHLLRFEDGLYRCLVNEIDTRVTVTYEIEVYDPPNYRHSPPKLLDIEIFPNTTIKPYSKVLLQCKVRSKLVPTIIWCKQADTPTSLSYEYQGKFYNPIKTDNRLYEKPNEDYVYVSKYKLDNATRANSGVYICFAVTAQGNDSKSFTMDIVEVNVKYERPMRLLLLFLIPLSFALIPVIVWLCYYRNKSVGDVKNNARFKQQEQTLIQYEFEFNGNESRMKV